ncbi:hypothetical protein AAFF_G00304810 [Aldrovandia affinis]|uniref:Uncharacterized protein n=1 Tax=Aldrovandia affinis TaxID=143900 RepID=A0AAD7SPA3_9TELE|nr:hypothetical protein AAFF_G00304810 [Aldrovandia affinis]
MDLGGDIAWPWSGSGSRGPINYKGSVIRAGRSGRLVADSPRVTSPGLTLGPGERRLRAAGSRAGPGPLRSCEGGTRPSLTAESQGRRAETAAPFKAPLLDRGPGVPQASLLSAVGEEAGDRVEELADREAAQDAAEA